jgi:hypothetical protein
MNYLYRVKHLKHTIMGKSIEKRDVGNYRIKIYLDTDPSDPRGDDNMGKMICFHNRYNLGDKHDYNTNDYNGWEEMFKAIDKKEDASIILPLYLYDHSGITMSTSSFYDRWDSGQVGFIVATKKAIRENWGVKNVTEKMREKAESLLIGEVKTYDQYLTGDVYGYRIFDLGLDGKKGKEVDSCWGFYGSDECMNEAISLAEGFTITDEIGVDSV